MVNGETAALLVSYGLYIILYYCIMWLYMYTGFHTKLCILLEHFVEDDTTLCVYVPRRLAAHGLGPLALRAMLLDDSDTHAAAIRAIEAPGRWVARPRQRNIELAMAKHGFGQQDANSIQALALTLVDGHGEGEAHGELLSAQCEREAR